MFRASLANFNARLEHVFLDLECEYHLVSAAPGLRPSKPALTLAGFQKWYGLTIMAYPHEEHERLASVMKKLPLEAINDLHNGKAERLPKELPRHLFPATHNAAKRSILCQVISKHFPGLENAPLDTSPVSLGAAPVFHKPQYPPIVRHSAPSLQLSCPPAQSGRSRRRDPEPSPRRGSENLDRAIASLPERYARPESRAEARPESRSGDRRSSRVLDGGRPESEKRDRESGARHGSEKRDRERDRDRERERERERERKREPERTSSTRRPPPRSSRSDMPPPPPVGSRSSSHRRSPMPRRASSPVRRPSKSPDVPRRSSSPGIRGRSPARPSGSYPSPRESTTRLPSIEVTQAPAYSSSSSGSGNYFALDSGREPDGVGADRYVPPLSRRSSVSTPRTADTVINLPRRESSQGGDGRWNSIRIPDGSNPTWGDVLPPSPRSRDYPPW